MNEPFGEKQYPIPREKFTAIVAKTITFDALMNTIWDGREYISDEFHIWRDNDETFICRVRDLTVINWYKNLGRCLRCNREMTEEEYEQFFNELKEALL